MSFYGNIMEFTTYLWSVLAIIATILFLIYVYFQKKFQYWKNLNVPHDQPTFPFGNMGNIFYQKNNFILELTKYCHKFKALGHKHCGYYRLNMVNYIPLDPKLLRNILSSDFTHFVNRGVYHDEKSDPLSAHLVALEDDKWKNMRSRLTPTFTSGKMKIMLQTLLDCSDQMLEFINNLHANHTPLDIREIVSCYTTDVIGSCAFGLDCNSFKDENAEFRKYGKKFFQFSLFKRIIALTRLVFPTFSKMLGSIRTPKDINDFFINIVRSTVEYREKNNVNRNDFLQLLIDLRNKKDTNFTFNEMAAQSFVFFLAGFETSSTALTFALFELANNQDVQDRLRDEIERVLVNYEEKVTYEALNEMKYLEQVIDETLRKYPPVPFVPRVCNKTYHVPDSDLVLEKGVKVIVPIYALHHDKEFFPNPDKFDPERFSVINKPKIVPYSYIPFGEGPRICIGLRFGMMEMKIGLVSILRKYNLTLNAKTPKNITLGRSLLILTPKDTLFLDTEEISVKENIINQAQ